jgi:hypothetical protein
MSIRRAIPVGTLAITLALGMTASRKAYADATPEKLPPGARVARLEVQPSRIDLKNPYAYTQLLVTAQLASGERIDVTRMVQIDRPNNLLRISPTGLVRPLADGQGSLSIRLEGQTTTASVSVSGQKEKY